MIEKAAQRVAVRAEIVLRAAEGLTNQAIALQSGVTGATVGKWGERYRVQGMKGLADDSRPGTPRRITDAQVEEAVTQTLEAIFCVAGRESAEASSPCVYLTADQS